MATLRFDGRFTAKRAVREQLDGKDAAKRDLDRWQTLVWPFIFIRASLEKPVDVASWDGSLTGSALEEAFDRPRDVFRQ